MLFSYNVIGKAEIHQRDKPACSFNFIHDRYFVLQSFRITLIFVTGAHFYIKEW